MVYNLSCGPIICFAGKTCRFKVTGWLAKKFKTPKAAEAHYCMPDTSAVSAHTCASIHKAATVSANVQTDDVNVSTITDLFNTLPVDDQMEVLSKLFSVYMLNSFCINVPEDFISYAANAMSELRLDQHTNILYNLAKGIGTLRPDSSDSRFPIKRMPMGLIEYSESFLSVMIYTRYVYYLVRFINM